MSITIRKIAKDLKLAVSTVSKALRDSYEISDETKQKVSDYARSHNYIPNPYAGSLKSRKTKNIAVVIPEVADTFFSNAINGIDSVAQANQYHVIIYLTHESAEREDEILKELRSGRVDGVLISVSVGVKSNSTTHASLAKELPLIFFDRACSEVETAKILTDDFESAYRATEHLIDCQCQEIIFLAYDGDLSILDQRRKGFEKALHDRHFDAGKVVVCPEGEEESMHIIREMLRNEKKVVGVIGSVEKVAMQVYKVCQELELAIPEDVKVLAFSNLQIASLLAPPLTTVVQPAFEMGKAAATLLFKALHKKATIQNESIVLPSVLVPRDSTR